MSILPYQEIKRRCEGEKPMVVPCVEKTVCKGKTYGLSESGYDMRIKQDVVLYPITLANLLNNHVHDNPDSTWVKGLKLFGFKNVERRPFFALASTIEYFNIPNDLMPKIEDKSSWARRGLSVFNTTAEPGWHGYLTLELKNNGHDVLKIEAGMPIAQMVFYSLTAPTDKPYEGKYNGQADEAVPFIYEKRDPTARRPHETEAAYLERRVRTIVDGDDDHNHPAGPTDW